MKRHQFSIARIMRWSLVVCLFSAWIGPPEFWSESERDRYTAGVQFRPRYYKWLKVYAMGYQRCDAEDSFYIWHYECTDPFALIINRKEGRRSAVSIQWENGTIDRLW